MKRYFEHQRWNSSKNSFTSECLTPNDPAPFSTENYDRNFPSLPRESDEPSLVFIGNFAIEKTSYTDAEGWSYAADFRSLREQNHGVSTRSPACMVRRRGLVTKFELQSQKAVSKSQAVPVQAATGLFSFLKWQNNSSPTTSLPQSPSHHHQEANNFSPDDRISVLIQVKSISCHFTCSSSESINKVRMLIEQCLRKRLTKWIVIMAKESNIPRRILSTFIKQADVQIGSIGLQVSPEKARTIDDRDTLFDVASDLLLHGPTASISLTRTESVDGEDDMTGVGGFSDSEDEDEGEEFGVGDIHCCHCSRQPSSLVNNFSVSRKLKLVGQSLTVKFRAKYSDLFIELSRQVSDTAFEVFSSDGNLKNCRPSVSTSLSESTEFCPKLSSVLIDEVSDILSIDLKSCNVGDSAIDQCFCPSISSIGSEQRSDTLGLLEVGMILSQADGIKLKLPSDEVSRLLAVTDYQLLQFDDKEPCLDCDVVSTVSTTPFISTTHGRSPFDIRLKINTIECAQFKGLSQQQLFVNIMLGDSIVARTRRVACAAVTTFHESFKLPLLHQMSSLSLVVCKCNNKTQDHVETIGKIVFYVYSLNQGKSSVEVAVVGSNAKANIDIELVHKTLISVESWNRRNVIELSQLKQAASLVLTSLGDEEVAATMDRLEWALEDKVISSQSVNIIKNDARKQVELRDVFSRAIRDVMSSKSIDQSELESTSRLSTFLCDRSSTIFRIHDACFLEDLLQDFVNLQSSSTAGKPYVSMCKTYPYKDLAGPRVLALSGAPKKNASSKISKVRDGVDALLNSATRSIETCQQQTVFATMRKTKFNSGKQAFVTVAKSAALAALFCGICGVAVGMAPAVAALGGAVLLGSAATALAAKSFMSNKNEYTFVITISDKPSFSRSLKDNVTSFGFCCTSASQYWKWLAYLKQGMDYTAKIQTDYFSLSEMKQEVIEAETQLQKADSECSVKNPALASKFLELQASIRSIESEMQALMCPKLQLKEKLLKKPDCMGIVAESSSRYVEIDGSTLSFSYGKSDKRSDSNRVISFFDILFITQSTDFPDVQPYVAKLNIVSGEFNPDGQTRPQIVACTAGFGGTCLRTGLRRGNNPIWKQVLELPLSEQFVGRLGIGMEFCRGSDESSMRFWGETFLPLSALVTGESSIPGANLKVTLAQEETKSGEGSTDSDEISISLPIHSKRKVMEVQLLEVMGFTNEFLSSGSTVLVDFVNIGDSFVVDKKQFSASDFLAVSKECQKIQLSLSRTIIRVGEFDSFDSFSHLRLRIVPSATSDNHLSLLLIPLFEVPILSAVNASEEGGFGVRLWPPVLSAISKTGLANMLPSSAARSGTTNMTILGESPTIHVAFRICPPWTLTNSEVLGRVTVKLSLSSIASYHSKWPSVAFSSDKADERFNAQLGYDGLCLSVPRHDVASKSSSLKLEAFCRPPNTNEKRRKLKNVPPSVTESALVVELYENQRFQPFVGWGSKYPGHFLPTDRGMFSDDMGYENLNVADLSPLLALPGFSWFGGSWAVDVNFTNCDTSGWSYASNFPMLSDYLQSNTSISRPTLEVVRRRKWTRIMVENSEELQSLLSGVAPEIPIDLLPFCVTPLQQLQRSIVAAEFDHYRIEIFENERYVPIKKWGSSYPGHLLPTDPPSDENGHHSVLSLGTVTLPQGFVWKMDSWAADFGYTACDSENWSYAIDFPYLKRNQKSSGYGMTSYVRRKLWFRMFDVDVSVSARPSVSEQKLEMSPNSPVSIVEKAKLQTYWLSSETDNIRQEIVVPWSQVTGVTALSNSTAYIEFTLHMPTLDDHDSVTHYHDVAAAIVMGPCWSEEIEHIITERTRLENVRTMMKTLSGNISMIKGSSLQSDSGLTMGSVVEYGLACLRELNRLRALYSSDFCRTLTQIISEDSDIVRFANEAIRFQRTSIRLRCLSAELCCLGLSSQGMESLDFLNSVVHSDVARFAADHHHRATLNDLASKSNQDMFLDISQALPERIMQWMLSCNNAYSSAALRNSEIDPNDLDKLSDNMRTGVEIIVNGYFRSAVSSLSVLIDSVQSSLLMPDQGSKQDVLKFVLSQDNKISDIVVPVLHAIGLKCVPVPSLSLSVDLNLLVSWYSNIIEADLCCHCAKVFRFHSSSMTNEEFEYFQKIGPLSPLYPIKIESSQGEFLWNIYSSVSGSDVRFTSYFMEDLFRIMNSFLDSVLPDSQIDLILGRNDGFSSWRKRKSFLLTRIAIGTLSALSAACVQMTNAISVRNWIVNTDGDSSIATRVRLLNSQFLVAQMNDSCLVISKYIPQIIGKFSADVTTEHSFLRHLSECQSSFEKFGNSCALILSNMIFAFRQMECIENSAVSNWLSLDEPTGGPFSLATHHLHTHCNCICEWSLDAATVIFAQHIINRLVEKYLIVLRDASMLKAESLHSARLSGVSVASIFTVNQGHINRLLHDICEIYDFIRIFVRGNHEAKACLHRTVFPLLSSFYILATLTQADSPNSSSVRAMLQQCNALLMEKFADVLNEFPKPDVLSDCLNRTMTLYSATPRAAAIFCQMIILLRIDQLPPTHEAWNIASIPPANHASVNTSNQSMLSRVFENESLKIFQPVPIAEAKSTQHAADKTKNTDAKKRTSISLLESKDSDMDVTIKAEEKPSILPAVEEKVKPVKKRAIAANESEVKTSQTTTRRALNVAVGECKNLPIAAGSWMSRSRPYVRVKHSDQTAVCTKVKSSSEKLVWNETLVIPLEGEPKQLLVEVMEKRSLLDDVVIASATIPVSSVSYGRISEIISLAPAGVVQLEISLV